MPLVAPCTMCHAKIKDNMRALKALQLLRGCGVETGPTCGPSLMQSQGTTAGASIGARYVLLCTDYEE